MTDLRALTDAFAELERRADAASARVLPEHSPPARLRPAPRPGSRLVPVAATVAVVAGLAAGAALLAPGGNPGTPAGGSPTAGESTITQPAPAFAIPDTPEELAARFRAVLGETATFTVTDTGAVAVLTAPPSPPAEPSGQQAPLPATTFVGAAIVGTLTASGVTGGFDLQIYPGSPGEQARCDDPDPSRCTVRRLADGSSLAVGQVPLDGSPNGITYLVNLIRPDGVVFLMHVSNERSPKGHSELLAPQPPLSTDQMIAIVTSDRW